MRLPGRLIPGLAACMFPAMADAGCATGGLVSAQTQVARTLTITNLSDSETLTLYWIGFDGAAAVYSEIVPRAQIVQPTFTGHVWAIESGGGACETVIVVESDLDLGVR